MHTQKNHRWHSGPWHSVTTKRMGNSAWTWNQTRKGTIKEKGLLSFMSCASFSYHVFNFTKTQKPSKTSHKVGLQCTSNVSTQEEVYSRTRHSLKKVKDRLAQGAGRAGFPLRPMQHPSAWFVVLYTQRTPSLHSSRHDQHTSLSLFPHVWGW